MMHGGAPAALLAQAVCAVQPGADMFVSRLTIEFLGGVPLEPLTVAAEVTKPGRRFQLVEATLDAGGKRKAIARAVRLRRAELGEAERAGAGLPGMPPRSEGVAMPAYVPPTAEMFYPDAIEIIHVRGEHGAGAAAAWFRMRGEVSPGEAPQPLARVAAAADFANGLSWTLPWEDWLFVNTELTIHVFREAAGEWIGLDARTAIGPQGAGLSTGTLYDERGPIGACAQVLYVEPR